MRGHLKKKGRRWWWLAGSVLLVWLVAVIVVKANRPQVVTPTGNELYDRFAELVANEFAKRDHPGFYGRILSYLRINFHRSMDPNLTPIKGWESRYANDPQYWQLRWFCQVDDEPYEILVDSIRRGIYDEGSFYLIATKYDQEGVCTDEERLEFLDLAIAENPDNTFYYYYKAFWNISLGEIDTAMEALEQGNTAPDCYIPRPMPMNVIEEQQAILTSRNDQIVAGWIVVEYPLPNYIFIKDVYKDAVLCAYLGYTVKLLDDLTEAAVRMIDAPNATYLDRFVDIVLYRVVVNDVANEYIDLNDQQLVEYYYLESIHQQLRSILKNRTTALPLTSRQFYIDEYEYFITANGTKGKFIEKSQELLPPPLEIWARGELVGYDIPPSLVLDESGDEEEDEGDGL